MVLISKLAPRRSRIGHDIRKSTWSSENQANGVKGGPRTRWTSLSRTRSPATSGRYNPNADIFHARDDDGREFEVAPDRHDQRAARPQPRRAVLRATGQHARHAASPVASCSPTGSSTRRRRRPRLRGQADHLRRRAPPTSTVREAGLVGQADPPDRPTSTIASQFGDGRARLPRVPHHIDMTGNKVEQPPGDRHDLAADLRLLDRLPMTGEDRFLKAAETGIEYLPRAHSQRRHGRGRHVLVSRHRDRRRAERAEDPRVRVRRRLQGDPGLRADLRAGRPAQMLPRHRRPADQERHRKTRLAVRAVLPRPGAAAATARTSTRSRSTARATASAATAPARTGTRSATTSRPT